MQTTTLVITQEDLEIALLAIRATRSTIADIQSKIDAGALIEDGPISVKDILPRVHNGTIGAAFGRKLRRIVKTGRWRRYFPLLASAILAYLCAGIVFTFSPICKRVAGAVARFTS